MSFSWIKTPNEAQWNRSNLEFLLRRMKFDLCVPQYLKGFFLMQNMTSGVELDKELRSFIYLVEIP